MKAKKKVQKSKVQSKQDILQKKPFGQSLQTRRNKCGGGA